MCVTEAAADMIKPARSGAAERVANLIS
jgi:hypothetical protein